MPNIHLHVSALQVFTAFLAFLLAWIPVKIVAAHFEDRSALASAVLHVL